MFEINLVRSIKKEPEKKIAITPSPIFVSLCLLFILELFLFYYIRGNMVTMLSSLSKEIKEYEQRVSILNENLGKMTSLKGTLDALIAEKDDWWEKLSVISREIPSNLWLSSIRTEIKGVPSGKETSDYVKILYIEGYVYSPKEEPNIKEVGRFLERLKNNNEIRKRFLPPKLNYIKKSDPSSLLIQFNISMERRKGEM